MKSVLCVGLATLLFSIAAHAEQTVYRWRDDNGITHHSYQPPLDGRYYERVAVKSIGTDVRIEGTPPAEATGQKKELSYAQKRKAERAERRKKRKAEKQTLAEQCEEIGSRSAQLEARPNVLVKKADGSVVRMDDEERIQTLNQAKAFLREHCD